MDNGDATQGHAMTSAEFAKLMGAYPQPAENPLPAYGGYMDNSPANFSFVEFNDYFGAETFEADTYTGYRCKCGYGIHTTFDGSEINPCKECGNTSRTGTLSAETFEAERIHGDERLDRWVENNYGEEYDWELLDEYAVYGDVYEELKDFIVLDDEGNEHKGIVIVYRDDETFEAPYAGAGSLFGIGQNTGLEGFTTNELTTSSAIHGDFDEASLNYSGHQNFEVRAESDKLHGWATTMLRDVKFLIEDIEAGIVNDLYDCRERLVKIRDDTSHLNAETFSSEYKHCDACEEVRSIDEFSLSNDPEQTLTEGEVCDYCFGSFYDAEMDIIDDSNARIKNRFGEVIGMVGVDDHDVEDAIVEVSDGSDVIQEVIVSESETVEIAKKSMIPLALGAIAGLIAYPTVTSFFTKTEEKASETPELIETPNTGNLDPAQYEELVVESTGYAVDVIPQGLDGSFMGSRFAALPTERYVDYNEPGIGAHTDIALSRDEMYLEPEMAMVQASENVIKETQAPGQSPYNSMTGEENPDFDMRVLKETEVVSLDPAVKPFIPQSMSGYTGNANTPPSVFNKMFNLGVLGQTPAFVPGSGDMGASHTGSRNATPNTLGLGGSVGGPLSDQVNANYTDGTTSMSLAQWSIENTVSQTSDTEAVVIDRSSGLMKRVRRV